MNVSGPHGANVQGSRYSPDKSKFISLLSIKCIDVNINYIVVFEDEYATSTANSEANTSTTNKKYLETNLVGKVKWFNVKAGFGFINRLVSFYF